MGELFFKNIGAIFWGGDMKMNKEEFLRQLEQLLSGISEEERTDAIAFYRSYFEDAGEENEAAILAELESPQKVAESIMKNLGVDGNGTMKNLGVDGNGTMKNLGVDGNGTMKNPGMNGDGIVRNSITDENSIMENPGMDGNGAGAAYGEDAYAGNAYSGNTYAAGGYAPKEEAKKGNSVAVAVIVAVLTSPIWLLLLLILMSVLIAVVATLFGIAVAVVAVMAALIFTGFALIGVGIAWLFGGAPAVGIGLTGGGLIVLALGILTVLLVVWIFGAFLPWAFKGIGNLCRKLLGKGKERAAV